MGSTPQWQVATPEAHIGGVQHARHSSRVIIYIDGRRILNRGSRDREVNWDDPIEHEFRIDDAQCKILVGGDYCHLWVNGELAEQTGQS